MASTSVSPSFKYDVFLSFRGEDTRKTFVDHLYLALVNKGIITYKDDEKIKQGEKIDDQLMRSIEESRFYIIIFSKNYADSSWCLQELTKIMECHNTNKQTAYPVFYDVEPTEVRNQIGAVGEAFNKHVRNKAAHKWRDALKQAAGLAGWELKNTVNGHEAKFVQKIVQDISLQPHFINSNIDNMLVGMDIRVKNVISSLEIDREDDVRMVGIWGMGGGGKTTLARAVYDHISIWFEGKSFVENVRECSKSSGLKELQKQILSSVLNDKSINVTGVFDGKNMMKRMMGSRKVLVVLDDVDHTEQLDALVGDLTWFNPGSRIIITTRDEQVLIAQGVHKENIHDVNFLSRDEAICLLSKYAFKREIPVQGYEELCEEVVHYAAGLPLTIKVLGSFLCGRLEKEWEDAIERLQSIPLKETLEKLELSYNGLENDHKEIFLDIVCMLKHKRIHVAIRILESCGFHAQIGLRVLEQKSLLTISDGYLKMHDHIEEMGRNIVRRLHPNEPSRHSRLWIPEDFSDILGNDLGTKATRSMKLEFPDIHPCVVMKSLKKMKKLRLLSVLNVSKEWEIHESGQHLPNALRSMQWIGYPFSSLPKTFRANNLVNLELGCSNISQLWEGGERKVLEKLTFLYLGSSKLATFDLGLTPNIEELNLQGCNGLVELQMPAELSKLNKLVLSRSKVSNLNLGLTPNIEELCLQGCNDLVELQMPAELPKLNKLVLSDSKVNNLNLVLTPNIKELYLDGCEDLVKLQMPAELPQLNKLVLGNSKVSNLNLGLTPNIVELDLRGCNGLVGLQMPVELPKLNKLVLGYSKVSNLNLGLTPNIKELYLDGCKDLVKLQMPAELPKLNKLILNHSKMSSLNLGLTPNIKELCLEGFKDLVELQMPVELQKLNQLNLSRSKVGNLNLEMTPNIMYVYLEGCKDLVELQMPAELPKLNKLVLSHSKVSNLNLGLTPNIEYLYLKECKDLVEIQMPAELPKLYYLNLSHSKMSNLNLGMIPNIKELYLQGCKDLVELQMPVELPKLSQLNLSHSKVGYLNLGLTPDLEVLSLFKCYYLQEIQAPMGCLKKLTNLNLSGCSRFEYCLVHKQYKSPGMESLATLKLIAGSQDMCLMHPNSNLPKFQVKCIYDQAIPSSSGNLEKLISFGLCACPNLESFSANICSLQHLIMLTLEGSIPDAPKDLWKLETLEKLTLSLKEINHLPDSICILKHLKSLNLKSCWFLEHLPMNLGRLDCLEELDLTDCTSLQDIPNSICKMKCLKYLNLRFCFLVEKLPDELGRVECLELLNIEGAGGISCLPQSIFQLKDLCIIGSTWQLKSYGFTSLRKISTFTASCFVGNLHDLNHEVVIE